MIAGSEEAKPPKLDQNESTRPGRSHRRLLLKIALNLIGLTLLIHVFYKNSGAFREVLNRAPDFRLLSLAFVICLSGLVTTFIRWMIVVRAQGLTLRLRDALRVGFMGNAIDLIIPGQIGGDIFKANFLCRTQAWKVRAIASIFIDRALGILGLFTLAGSMGVLNWTTAPPLVRRLILVAIAVWLAGAIAFAAILTPSLFSLVVQRFINRKRLSVLLGELQAMSLAYSDRKGAVATGLLMSTASHALYALSFHVVGLALLPIASSLQNTMLMVPLVLFTTIIPLPFGALGLSEQVSDDLFRLYGNINGAPTMLAFRLVSLAVTCISIAVYVWNSREIAALRRNKGDDEL